MPLTEAELNEEKLFEKAEVNIIRRSDGQNQSYEFEIDYWFDRGGSVVQIHTWATKGPDSNYILWQHVCIQILVNVCKLVEDTRTKHAIMR